MGVLLAAELFVGARLEEGFRFMYCPGLKVFRLRVLFYILDENSHHFPVHKIFQT